uniref:Uncharacterized protein n=1 Tax=Cacopsylla melanoneura TaxID=428564 RepID=A0A8D9E841_9HEMI
MIMLLCIIVLYDHVLFSLPWLFFRQHQTYHQIPCLVDVSLSSHPTVVFQLKKFTFSFFHVSLMSLKDPPSTAHVTNMQHEEFLLHVSYVQRKCQIRHLFFHKISHILWQGRRSVYDKMINNYDRQNISHIWEFSF